MGRPRAVISSAYAASARPATMIVVVTVPFTLDMLLRFVVTGRSCSAFNQVTMAVE